MIEKTNQFANAWKQFTSGEWKNEVNVRDFIQTNYTPYEGDESFLSEATPATTIVGPEIETVS